MKLITKEIEKAFKKQGYTGDKSADQIMIVCKLFNPSGAGTWYLYEKEDDDIYWCFANLGDPINAECGTISMSEIESIKLPPFGLGIERDMHFEPLTISLKTVQETIKNGGHI